MSDSAESDGKLLLREAARFGWLLLTVGDVSQSQGDVGIDIQKVVEYD